MDRCIEERNLTGEQWAELEAFDEIEGLGYSRRDDARAKRHTSLLLWAQGEKDLDDDLFDYLPRTQDPPTDDLERLL